MSLNDFLTLAIKRVLDLELTCPKTSTPRLFINVLGKNTSNVRSMYPKLVNTIASKESTNTSHIASTLGGVVIGLGILH
jgi:hypothetical protein